MKVLLFVNLLMSVTHAFDVKYEDDTYGDQYIYGGHGCKDTTSHVESVEPIRDTRCVQLYQNFGCVGKTMKIRDASYTDLSWWHQTTGSDGSRIYWKHRVLSMSDCDEGDGTSTGSAVLCIQSPGVCTDITYLRPGECINLGWLEKRTSRIYVNQGCIQVWDGKDCSSTTKQFSSTAFDLDNYPHPTKRHWDNEIVSVSGCDYSSVPKHERFFYTH